MIEPTEATDPSAWPAPGICPRCNADMVNITLMRDEKFHYTCTRCPYDTWGSTITPAQRKAAIDRFNELRTIF